MTIYICGNSHTQALVNGFRKAGVSASTDVKAFYLGNGKFETQPFSSRQGAETAFLVEDYTNNVLKHTGSPTISERAIWGFCNVNHNGRVYGQKMWLTHEPASICRAGACPVSDNVLNEIISQDTFHIRRFFEQVKASGVTVFAISGPFPRQDHSCLEAGTRREVVSYIDRAARQMWETWLSEQGIPYVAPPPGTMTEDGFLKKKFDAAPYKEGLKDPHHANWEYGLIMCRKIIAAVKKAGWLPAHDGNRREAFRTG